MCDQDQIARMAGLSRRQFGALGGAATLAACTTMGDTGDTAGLAEGMVTIATPSGQADAFYVRPAEGRHPAVIVWPDIAGLRGAFYRMARRLAGEGYAVLTVNPYYRDVAGEQFADFAAFSQAGGFQRVGPWRAKLTAEAIRSDARAYTAWLDGQDAVDTARGIGTQGYCMGGPFTVWSAAASPRVRAAASFHGGGLVRDGAMSPHNLLAGTQAAFLIAIAQDDDAENPDHKTILRGAAGAAGRPAEIEVYPADHGWTVPDSPSYEEAAAERAWAALLALYARAL